MAELIKYLRQVPAYLALAWMLGYFATMPAYHYGDPNVSTIKLSLSHAADRAAPCVQLTQEEIAELAANMRRTETCERQRLPLVLEMEIDGERIYSITAEPSGVWGDGAASIYERLDVEPGPHSVSVRLRDTARAEGWDYEKTGDVVLEPGRYFTVTFRAETGGFNFR